VAEPSYALLISLKEDQEEDILPRTYWVEMHGNTNWRVKQGSGTRI
jgi:hypothetical protein